MQKRQETQVRSLGQEDPLDEEMANQSSVLAWKIPMERGAWKAISPWGHKELDKTERLCMHVHWGSERLDDLPKCLRK